MVATGGRPLPQRLGLRISVSGTGPRVLNNDVIDVQKQGTGTAHGIEDVYEQIH